MSVFTEGPYNLSEDDLIVVRAIASNALGDGSWSAPNNSVAVVVTPPPALASPVFTETPAGFITVSWNSLDTADDYELEYDKERDGTFVQIYKGEETSFTIAKEEGRRTYSFRVRALNSCSSESSPFSPVLSFSFTSVPERVTDVTTYAEAC
jgi:hypothetical protein